LKTRHGDPTVGSLAIVPMAIADLPEVVEIERHSFPSPWTEGSFRHELLENPYSCMFVVKGPRPSESDVVGFACVWVVDQEMRINNIAVHPRCRRRGIGTRLLNFLLEQAGLQGCREATLEVRPSNGSALRVYEGAGFRAVGRRKNYYSDTHEDAVVMARPVQPARRA
jgi:ribosomal-protein-alanine N-acetyltransferase